MAGGFERVGEGTDDVLVGEGERAVCVCPAVEILAEGFAGYGECVAVDEFVFE